MGATIGQVLGNAVGIAISPVPIIALILMLFSGSAARNSIAFAMGWLVGLTAVGMVVLAIGVEADGGGESDAGGALKIVIGVAFLALAVRTWRQRPEPGADPAMPGWMSAVDDLSPAKAAGMGALLSAVNPKNLGLMIAAAVTISAAGLDTGAEVTTLLITVVIASITIIVPVVGYLVARERMTPVLESAKTWLIANNNTVMAVLFAVLGAKALGDGIAIVAR